MAALAVVLVVQFACNEPRSWSRNHSPSPGDYSKSWRSTFKNVPSFYDRCAVRVVTTGGTLRAGVLIRRRTPACLTLKVVITTSDALFKAPRASFLLVLDQFSRCVPLPDP